MGLFDTLKQEFSKTSSDNIGQAVEELVGQALGMRKAHERRWFDNNFFDDGYHFKVVSKKTGRIVDHVNVTNSYVERAIPRASRQIRSVANLLFAAEPYPVVFPERLTMTKFPSEEAFKKAQEAAKLIARKQGTWISTEWENQELAIKLIDMMLLASKNSISYLQVYSDTDKQEIVTNIYDGFDVVVFGDRRDLDTLPFISKTCPMDLVDVFRNPIFDQDKLKNLKPDNKYATSEIKDAYMRTRFGDKVSDGKKNGSVIVKETFMKEVLTEDNWEQAVKLSGENGAMEGKSKNDLIMRHVFSAGGITLRDEYVDYDKYPFAEFRFEPGNLYQVPFIERFIPQNKSIDVIVTRLEKWINAMIVGVYQKRKGENFQMSNFPGGQMVEYETTPLQQMQTSSVGATPFNVLELLNKYTDEQGATTAGGINVPTGVKSGVAIESVKATEYANLKISTLMLKKTIRKITELMLERADKDYMEPKEVSYMEDGEPQYFDVIGSRGMMLSERVNKELPESVIPLKKDLKVRIEIEPGLGLTMDGKKEAMQQIIDYMIKLAQLQVLPMEAIKQVVKRFMETFGYGSTQEFMEVLDNAPMPNSMDEDQLMKMKIAIIEALKDAGAVGPEMEARLVDSTKVGVLETLKDAGLLDKEKSLDNPELDAIPYKDAPPSIKRQMEAKAGLVPAQDESPSETDQKIKRVQVVNQVTQSKSDSYPINKFRKKGAV